MNPFSPTSPKHEMQEFGLSIKYIHATYEQESTTQYRRYTSAPGFRCCASYRVHIFPRSINQELLATLKSSIFLGLNRAQTCKIS